MSDEPNHATDDPTAGAPGLDPEAVLGMPARSDESTVEDSSGLEQASSDEGVRGDESRTEETSKPAAPAPLKSPPPPTIDLDALGPDPSSRQWYILKVQSNREDSIVDGLQRRVAIAGLEDYFGEIIIPVEMVTEFKNGKKRIVKRKLYPGYIMVNMQITDDTWFLVRDTAGIGDFTGSGGKPIPMQPHEVSRLISKQDEKQEEAPKLKINFKVDDRVKINEGTFENFEGDVNSIDEANGRVVVMINIFGRSTPVELEYWQVESI